MNTRILSSSIFVSFNNSSAKGGDLPIYIYIYKWTYNCPSLLTGDKMSLIVYIIMYLLSLKCSDKIVDSRTQDRDPLF